MDGPRIVLELLRERRLVKGHLRGLFHIAIGRKLTRANGTVISIGISWRELSQLLKSLKFEREFVRELGSDPDLLSTKDRERFWYAAITLAKVDSSQARREAEELAAALKSHGILVGPAPAAPPVPTPVDRSATPAPPPAAGKATEGDPSETVIPPVKPPKGKKKK